MKTEFYACSPQLSCLSRSNLSLTLCHFGNVSLFNTLDPDLSLTLLRAVKNEPKTLEMLVKEIDGSKVPAIHAELKRLISARYIFTCEDPQLTAGTAPGVNLFGREQAARAKLTRILADTKVEIWDLIKAGEDLGTHLTKLGFDHVRSVALKPGQDLSRLKPKDEFVVVLAMAEHQMQISQMNKMLRQHGKRWLLVFLDAFGGIIGPAFGSKGGPCFDCLIDSSKRSFSVVTSPFAPPDLLLSDALPTTEDKPLGRNVLPFVGPELIKILSNLAPASSTDGFFSLDLFNLRTQFTAVQPSPTCPTCAVRPKNKIAKASSTNRESRRV
jgi:bacteriocin biosynthesis cyclodehydratase domain-containing protein